jgi:hypothetical protein
MGPGLLVGEQERNLFLNFNCGHFKMVPIFEQVYTIIPTKP